MKAANWNDSHWMSRRVLDAVATTTHLGLVLSALVAISGCPADEDPGIAGSSTSDDDSVAGPHADPPAEPPTPRAVDLQLTAAYEHPERHAITAQDTAWPDLIAWHRTYDGVDMLVDSKSVLLEDGRWETRSFPELQEPPPVDRSRVLSPGAAAAAIGIGQELDQGVVTARYVYEPVFVDIPNKAVVENALDVDRYIGEYVLAIELVNSATGVTMLVDAYSGVERARMSREKRFAEVQVPLDVTTLNYGVVQVSMSARPRGRYQATFTYKDLDRCTTTNTTMPPTCKNGQGVASPAFQNDLVNAIPYFSVILTVPPEGDVVVGSSIHNDLYFGIQTSWDYFLAAHGRRGMSNITQPGSYHWAPNDAIGRLLPSTDSLGNVGMNVGTGVITVYTTGNDAIDRTLVRLSSIGHEWAHGVFATEVQNHVLLDLFYWGEEGGLNESSSDLFGKLIEAYGLHRIGRQTDASILDWTISTRDMCTPSRDGSSFDEWSEGFNVAANDPHRTSGPVNRVHCLMARGLRPYGTSFHEPGLQSARVPTPGFSGIGSDRVAKIWYRTLTKLRGRPRPLSFADARAQHLLAAQELYGLYSPEYKAVEDSWAVVNIGAPAERTPPVVTLLTPGPFKPGDPIAVDVADADGVKEVTLWIDSGPAITLTAPPWQFQPAALSDGSHGFHVTATDNKNSSKTYHFPIYADFFGPTVAAAEATTCGTSNFCPAFRLKKKFSVSATDVAGVAQVELVVNGVVVDTFAGASNVFEYTFPGPGVYDVRGRARDTYGHVGEMAVPNFKLDTTPPTFFPVVTESTTEDGSVTWNLCAQDQSSPLPLLFAQLEIDGVLANVRHNQYSSTCVKLTAEDVPLGHHTYVVRVFDKWGNEGLRSGSFTVARIAPVMSTPTVTVDTTQIGRVVISTTVTAASGTSWIQWRAEPLSEDAESVAVATSPNTSHDNLRTFSQELVGLVPGATYYATVIVVGNNDLVVSRSSAPFTIPSGPAPPPTVVFHEVERNDKEEVSCSIPPANVLPSNARRIEGTYHGRADGNAPWLVYDSDLFRMTLPVGKTLHVTSSFKCDDGGPHLISSAEVSVYRFSPTNGSNCSLGDLAATAGADGSISLQVPGQTSFGSHDVLINVEYPHTFPGQLCSNPSYSLDIIVN